jgi:hypothetical protein
MKLGLFNCEGEMESESIHIAFGCLDVIEKPKLADKSAEDYSLSMQNESDCEN